jgi:DNA-3-methyladenine glycosylase II
MAEAWRPWRGVAAHLLWAYYHAVKKRDVVPIQPGAPVKKIKKKPKKKARKKTKKTSKQRKTNG